MATHRDIPFDSRKNHGSDGEVVAMLAGGKLDVRKRGDVLVDHEVFLASAFSERINHFSLECGIFHSTVHTGSSRSIYGRRLVPPYAVRASN